MIVGFKYDRGYTMVFHSPGVEPWITGLLKSLRSESVLDVGCGLGFWGLVLKGYIGVRRVACVEVDEGKAGFSRSLGVYDEVYVSDIRLFDCAKCFDVVLAVESIHGILDRDLLRRLESMARRAVILALPEARVSLSSYRVYRYVMRGFLLIGVDGEVLTHPSRLWRLMGWFVKLVHPLLKSLRLLGRGYLLAYKVVDFGEGFER